MVDKNQVFEIGENVIITDRTQILSITPEQAKKIKSLRIENQEIDFEFDDFFYSKFNGRDLDSLYFINCEMNYMFLYDISSSKLGCINCALTSDHASSYLRIISRWDYIETLDLSQNKFGEDAETFYSWMWKSVFGCVSIKNLILSDNGFSEEWEKKIVSSFGKCTSLII